MSVELEEGTSLTLDFSKLNKVAAGTEDVIPVAVQDVESGDVLIVGYANQQALDHTLSESVATLWSTSKNELWVKGATSGDYLDVVDVRVNCEQNSLLYRVRLRGGGSCHTKKKDGSSRHGCYYRSIHDRELTFV